MRVLVSTVVWAILLGSAVAENWPVWRGPSGNGVSTEKGIAVRWSSQENVQWKAEIGGVGASSPVVWGERIFVTSQLGRGPLRPGSHPTLARGGQEVDEKPLGDASSLPDADRPVFLVEGFDTASGRRVWQHRLVAEGYLPEVHSKHNMASPSPVTDGEYVFAWFATGQLVALDMNGQLVWERHLGEENSPFDIGWGHGSSPALYRDLLILQCDHRPASYLLALDKRTGEQRWKVDREPGTNSHSTPFVAATTDRDELIVNSTKRVDAYDPSTGKQLWFAGEEVRFGIPVPAYNNGILYMSRGYRSGPYMALKTGGKGDVSETHILWHVPTGAPYISSLVYYDGLVYMANGLGVVTCLDPETGNRVWQERIGGIYSASPVAADGRIYLLNESGETVVLRAGRELQVLSRNPIEERVVASPAISNGRFFIRSDRSLFSIARF